MTIGSNLRFRNSGRRQAAFMQPRYQIAELQHFVRPYGANHQWVKVPHQEFSVCLDS